MLGSEDVGFTITSDVQLAFNTSTQAVNETFQLGGGQTAQLVLPAGKYFRFSALDANLHVYLDSGYDLGGNFQVEQVNGIVRIAATNVHASGGGVEISGGTGALILYPNGSAGQISGHGSGGDASGDILIVFNTRPAGAANNVDTTVTVNGEAIHVVAPAHQWSVAAHLSVELGDFLTLTGDFKAGTIDGGHVYGARNVEIFVGDGPYRLADGSVNPDAIGVPITNGDDRRRQVRRRRRRRQLRALRLRPGAAVGLDGLTLSGNVRVLINKTGRAYTTPIDLPALGGSPGGQIAMPFTSAASSPRSTPASRPTAPSTRRSC